MMLNLPVPVPIATVAYTSSNGRRHKIRVYPTAQFLYSHHIQADYITEEVRRFLNGSVSEKFSLHG